MREKFFALSRFSQILFIVFCLHFLLLFSLFLHHLFSQKPKISKIVVRTVLPQVQPPMAVSSKPATKAEPKKAPAAPKKEKPKDAAKTKTVPVKEKTASISIAAEIEKNLQALEAEKPLTASQFTPLAVPKNILPIVQMEAATMEEIDYGQTLAAYLETILELPEYGEVTVDLEVDARGSLIHFEMKEMKSAKNGEYLKKRLPELHLPCFNGLGGSHAARKFTITFKNAK